MTCFLALLVVHRLNKSEHPKDSHLPTRLTTDSHTALPLDALSLLYYHRPSIIETLKGYWVTTKQKQVVTSSPSHTSNLDF